MTIPPPNDDRREPGDSGGVLPIASLLRAHADGEQSELSAHDRARLDAHLASHPESESWIAFERSMRASVGRVLGEQRAPASLRARVAQIAQESAAGTIEQTPSTDQDALAASLESRAEQTRRMSFWRDRFRQVATVGVAAAVLLVGSVFVVRMGTTSPVQQHTAGQTELVGFASQEHDRCWVDKAYADEKFTAGPEQVEPLLGRILGTAPTMPALVEAGLRVVDAGKCKVPGDGPSVHLRLETIGTGGVPEGIPVSLFVQRSTQDDARFDEGITYAFESDPASASEQRRASIYIWRRDGMNFVLVAENREICELVREQADLPAPEDG